LVSPLRYPGGKASLAGLLASVIEANGYSGGTYLEPFAGGAGAALKLLSTGVVSRILINDYDPVVYAFWKTALSETDRFLDKIAGIPLTIEEWYRQKEIQDKKERHSIFDVGFSAFYLNRCSRSGIISRSGPIGGYEQAGKWKMDARFNRETLAKRIIELGKYRNHIKVTHLDALRFLERYASAANSFVYLDPPYVVKGSRLYLNHYKAEDHASLAKFLLDGGNSYAWVASYDDSSVIRDLYSSCVIFPFTLRHSVQNKGRGNELLIVPVHMSMATIADKLTIP
jgi:DNA adenine methylase